MIFLAMLLAGCSWHARYATRSTPEETIASAELERPVSIEWIRVPTPGGTLTAAVARPSGRGPFSVLVLLHGTHGFAREYVRLAEDLARSSGIVVITGCWFAGGQGAGRSFITPIDCPDAPAMPAHSSPESLASVGALVTTARNLPGVRGDQLALFGHSRGGGAALHYLIEQGNVRAAVLNSTGYPQEVVDRAASVSAPLLLLHGREDSPAHGGSAATAFENAQRFERRLIEEKRPVETRYFDGNHNDFFSNPDQYKETVELVAAFLRLKLHIRQVQGAGPNNSIKPTPLRGAA